MLCRRSSHPSLQGCRQGCLWGAEGVPIAALLYFIYKYAAPVYYSRGSCAQRVRALYNNNNNNNEGPRKYSYYMYMILKTQPQTQNDPHSHLQVQLLR